jgi:hypothetical protein
MRGVLASDRDAWVGGHGDGYTQVIPVEDSDYQPMQCPACEQAAWFSIETYVHVDPSGEPFRVESYTSMNMPTVVCEECRHVGPISEFRTWP